MPLSQHLLRAAAVALVTAVALLPAANASANAASASNCRSADLRYPFQPGGAKTFGVFELRITNGSCRKAHRVAKAWMAKFELNLLILEEVKLPRKAAGFAFTNLPAHEAQTFSERGRDGATTVRFDYRVPNG